jgi:hypothetical protein
VATYVDDDVAAYVDDDHIVGQKFSPYNFNWNHFNPPKMSITI